VQIAPRAVVVYDFINVYCVELQSECHVVDEGGPLESGVRESDIGGQLDNASSLIRCPELKIHSALATHDFVILLDHRFGK